MSAIVSVPLRSMALAFWALLVTARGLSAQDSGAAYEALLREFDAEVSATVASDWDGPDARSALLLARSYVAESIEAAVAGAGLSIEVTGSARPELNFEKVLSTPELPPKPCDFSCDCSCSFLDALCHLRCAACLAAIPLKYAACAAENAVRRLVSNKRLFRIRVNHVELDYRVHLQRLGVDLSPTLSDATARFSLHATAEFAANGTVQALDGYYALKGIAAIVFGPAASAALDCATWPMPVKMPKTGVGDVRPDATASGRMSLSASQAGVQAEWSPAIDYDLSFDRSPYGKFLEHNWTTVGLCPLPILGGVVWAAITEHKWTAGRRTATFSTQLLNKRVVFLGRNYQILGLVGERAVGLGVTYRE